MVKKVRRYILFFIIGLFSSFLGKKAEADAFMLKCNNGQSAKACCESAGKRLESVGGYVRWDESKGVCLALAEHYF